jgi:hypothetical protein
MTLGSDFSASGVSVVSSPFFSIFSGTTSSSSTTSSFVAKLYF